MQYPKVTKTLQEIVNLIVALNGGENKAELDEQHFKPWEVVSMLSGFAQSEEVAAIRARHDGEVFAKFEDGQDVMLLTESRIVKWPDTNTVWSESCRGNSRVRIHHSFWINLLDAPWGKDYDQYVGMGYVIQFVRDNGTLSDGHNSTFLVYETALASIEA